MQLILHAETLRYPQICLNKIFCQNPLFYLFCVKRYNQSCFKAKTTTVFSYKYDLFYKTM